MTLNRLYLLVWFLSITCITFVVVSIVGNGFFSPQPQWMVPSFKQKWKSSFSTGRIANQTGKKLVWKSGLKYNHTCNVSNRSRVGCCEENTNYIQLHLSPSGPSMENTVETFIRKTHSKHIVFMGDSILYQLFWGFQDALSLEFFDPLYHKRCDTCDCGFAHPCEGRHRESSLKIKMIAFYKIAQPSCANLLPERCVFFSDIQSILYTSDIVIFQIGIHYNADQKFVPLLTKFGQIAQEEMMKSPGKQVILRNTLPQHLSGEGGQYQPKMKHKGCTKISLYTEHWTNQHIKMTAEHYGLKYMDSAPFYVDRWDLHMKPTDCTHSCITPEVTVPEMALLNSLLD